MFLGFNFCSGENTLVSTTLPMRGTANAITIYDGRYTSLFASENNELTADTIPEDWDANTLLKTDFENGFDAGNTSFSLNNTEKLVIKRREIGDSKWTILFVKDIKKVTDFDIMFVDKYARAGTDYEYAVSSVSQRIENACVIQEIHSDFDGMYIADKDCLYGTVFNIDCNATSMQLSNQSLALLNSEYMSVVSNSSVKSESGSAAGTYIVFDDNNVNKFNRNKSIAYRKEIKNRLSSKKPMILKLFDGRIWMIRVVGQPQESHDGHYDVKQLSFDWMEVGDYNDMESLYRNALSDVGNEWW